MNHVSFQTVLGFVFLVCLMITGGCAPKRFPLASIEGVPGHFMQGQIIDMKTGKTITFAELINALDSVRLVFVGEVHDNPEHHLIETQILQALTARHDTLSVALEFLTVPRQSAVNQYMKGDLDETAFLDEVEWHKNWSFPYHFYRPLILSLRENGHPLFAVNAPGLIVKKVARSGLKSLTPEERKQVADHMDLENQAHREYLLEVYEAHPQRELKHFEYFYQAQCVWEETMAQEIARRLRKTRGKMVVFTGNGHIIHHFGIPDRVVRRIPVDMASVLLYPLTEASRMNKNMGDYVWLTSGCSAGTPMMHPPRPHPARSREPLQK